MILNLADLNESQIQAVLWKEGPVLVLAGPGSGKTRVLTHRIAHLISERPDGTDRILGLTFTNKAASEMRDRIAKLVPHQFGRAKLTTFHSIACEILRQHGSHIGVRPDFAIISEDSERLSLIEAATISIPSWNLDKLPQLSRLPGLIDRMHGSCERRMAVFDSSESDEFSEESRNLYSAYCAALVSTNVLDFGSLISFAVELLDTVPFVAEVIRDIYPNVCVDESQDSNHAQFRLLRQLVVGPSPNLFLVADDDQLIYQWNGANPSHLRDIQQEFNIPAIQLPENYRCPSEIVSIANRLIEHNDFRYVNRLPSISRRKANREIPILVSRYIDLDQELSGLGKYVQELSPEQRDNSVVLGRSNRVLKSTLECFDQKGILAYLNVRKSSFFSPPVRFLQSILRTLNSPNDSYQLHRLNSAVSVLGFSAVAYENLVERQASTGQSLFEIWLEAMDYHAESNRKWITPILAAAKGVTVDSNFRAFIGSGLATLEARFGSSQVSEVESNAEVMAEIEIWRKIEENVDSGSSIAATSIHTYLQEFELQSKEPVRESGSIRCMTIASSKGLEFEYVFLIGLVEDELPSYHAIKAGDASDSMREERRNCFVAITRASKLLRISYSDYVYGYRKKPSRFLTEMGLLA